MTTTGRKQRAGGRAAEHNGGSIARIINIVVGVWLFISAFVWPHTSASRTNTWIVGALCALFAAIALRIPQARWLNAVLSVWLFYSTLAFFRATGGTALNNTLAGVVMFIASLVPSQPMQRMNKPPRYVAP
ncbi:hypothetical protein [Corallococcus sp. 4LFB]|uniref:SPW repeat domain-containing protein n=1 Tax=Corallococcus sp. 4LFB TaxID=3383249 RepID=UPI0039771284